jgi:glycosyltransferase involved in cell wall biosynthesis
VRDNDPPGFHVEAVELGEPFDKYHYGRRLRQERRYGRLFTAHADRIAPDVLISCNVPLFAQRVIQRWAQRSRTPFVFWQQDVYSIAMRDGVREAYPGIGRLFGAGFVRMERRMLEHSDRVITISPDFEPILTQWGVPADRVRIIENWAPLDDLPALPRRNEWSGDHGLDEVDVLLYAGTLGLKHDPSLLLAVARAAAERGRTKLVVVSEGQGADWLAEHARREGLASLVLLPFQPIARFPEVLASADVLLAILEPEAGVFSVPSKILSYHCAGRAILASVPRANLAARTIAAAGSGVTVDPGDPERFAAAALQLLDDDALRNDLGAKARAHADTAFAIEPIGDRFEALLDELQTRGGG